ncbi:MULTISPECIES: hypothetical protein [Pseudomonas]|jgi:hypothetical protein|uniref:Uncharacterized protein n=4 Tax=Pseudomonas syringae TaxID=317 RepID=A0AB37ZFG7_PSESX|nr:MULTISPECIES: hypothetical protein [Pseudomonas]ALE00439.1 hypothetical protein PSYRMG_10915 [Pseudomonas syringae UMAF0158]ELQ14205.1 hypothetical protein A988_02593 [Pseudomonas syringae BRIP39023]KPB25637.1 Uncharacterized protein AC517_4255 [Pseudomonas syringae pv. syringae]KPY35257.1 Uncharacterized protein ALO65_02802 [Pseudomonas syringae pv. papulans]KTB94123.1 hypothetical protein AO073_11275 [Pseudomonas syringae ICMP 11293]
MTDPLDKATSTAPATLGEGCLSRYDPAELTAENGTDFDGAAALWRELQQAQAPDEGLEEEGTQEGK